MNIDGLIHLAEQLHDSGVKILAVNAVYESGHGYDVKVHDPALGNLWCGLAQSDPYRADQSLGQEQGLRRLQHALHSRGMALVSWFNPSYFWTGSRYFKQAEQHVRQYGPTLEGAPADSPARWFKWRGAMKDGDPSKPPDSKPGLNGVAYAYRWVRDPDANASYFSIWADQPSTDLASPAWQQEIGKILRHWIGMGIDGFVFDDPEGYISAGHRTEGHWQYEPTYIRQHITSVVRDFGHGRVVAMAELYGQPARATAYGLDVTFDHDYPEFRGTGLVAHAVGSGNMSLVERSFTGAQAIDAIQQQCYFAADEPCGIAWQRQPPMLAWLPGADVVGRNGYWCNATRGAKYAPASSGVMSLHACFDTCRQDAQCEGVSVDFGAKVAPDAGELEVECFKRGGIAVAQCGRAENSNRSTFGALAPTKMRLLMAVNLAAGYLTAIEQSADAQWWSNAAWPGSGGEPELKQLHATIEASPAFVHTALRLRLDLGQASSRQYALLRYNALDVFGSAAIAVFNFANTSGRVSLSLPKGLQAALGQRLRDAISGGAAGALTDGYAVTLPPYGYKLLDGLHLPRWERLRRADSSFLNCGDGYGAYWAPALPAGNMSLSACFVHCLGEPLCHAVTVGWGEDRSLVQCSLRGFVDAASCRAAEGNYSTFWWSLPLSV